VLFQAVPNGISLRRRPQTHEGTLQHWSLNVVCIAMASCQARDIDHLHVGAEAYYITGKWVLARAFAYLEKIAEQGVRVLGLVSIWKDAAYMNTVSESVCILQEWTSPKCAKDVCA